MMTVAARAPAAAEAPPTQFALLVTPEGAQVVQCPPTGGNRCSNQVLEIDARKMPFIAQNIEAAIDEGKANIVSKGDPSGDRARRAAACGRFKPAFGGSCDEFPFASTEQGGAEARVAEVHPPEQFCQGGTVRGFYRRTNIQPGQGFIVKVINKDAIPAGAYAGRDERRNKEACG